MTSEQILKKAIEKAVKNGYKKKFHNWQFLLQGNYYSIIFSHDFAKAFWGEANIIYPQIEYMSGVPGSYVAKNKLTEAWRIHLQQMVLEKEPLKYLEKFI